MFPYTMTDKGVSLFIDGKPIVFAHSHQNFEDIRKAIENNDEDKVRELVNIRAYVIKRTQGKINICENAILVDNKEVSGKLVDRILEMIARGNNAVDGYIKFMDNLYNNPRKTAIDELYLFLEACNLPITEDGYFLAYKKVTNDYKDVRTETFDNSIGSRPTMERDDVEDNREVCNGRGLHFCSYDYLSVYGGERVVVVKVNPADVVSIPIDYNNSKGRAWTYEVVGEIEDWSQNQITPWFTDEYSNEDDFREEIESDEFDDEEFDDEEFDETVVEEKPQSKGRPQKLSEADVRVIKFELGPKYDNGEITLTAIGKAFNIHRETVARILRGDIWAHVTS